MKTLIWLALLCPVAALAQETEIMTYESVEVDRADWLSWVGNPVNSLQGPELRVAVRAWQEAGRARVKDFVSLVFQSGEAGKSVSGDYLPYYSERDVERPSEFGLGLTASVGYPTWETLPVNFEHRSVGLSFQVWPDGIDLDRVSLVGERILGEAILPIFRAESYWGSPALEPGQFRFVGLGELTERVTLKFLRRDLHPLAKPAPPQPIPAGKSIEMKAVTMSLEWIEVGAEHLNPVPDREAVGRLIQEGKAIVREVSVLPLTPGVTEEFTMGEEQAIPDKYPTLGFDAKGNPTPDLPLMPERKTERLGFALEAQTGQYLNAGGVLTYELTARHTALKGMRSWGLPEWGLQFPDLHRVSVTCAGTLRPGRRELIGILQLPESPKPVLIFARCEVRRIATEPVQVAPNWPPEPEGWRLIVQVLETTAARLDTLWAKDGMSLAGPDLWNALAPQNPPVHTAALTLQGGKSKVSFGEEIRHPFHEFDGAWVHGESGKTLPPFPRKDFETELAGMSVTWNLPKHAEPGAPPIVKFEGRLARLNRIVPFFKPEDGVQMAEFHIQELTAVPHLVPNGEPSFLGTTQPGDDDRVWVWFVRASGLLP